MRLIQQVCCADVGKYHPFSVKHWRETSRFTKSFYIYEEGSRPVSRVLSRTVIHLDVRHRTPQATYPGTDADHIVRKANVPLFGLAPGGVYPAVECCHRRGALLPHHFTLTVTRKPGT